MRPRILAAVMLLVLCFSATANGDDWYGEFYADGYGRTEAEGAAAALYSLEGVLDDWEKILKPGQEFFVVVTDSTWDAPLFTITYWIVVVDTST